ncbi:cell division protein FtsA [Deinococcus lacus]|uniref:Cell division protein FtsA n=1 Tax=Deinococcus lacus TaxID=392561 RepID=A0ABW1Y9S4_9DEIO
MKDSKFIVGLDVGTSKITTVIGEVAPDGTVDIIGQGTVQSEGLKRGSVVNLERATQAIRDSVSRAERVSGTQVSSVFVSVAGNHTKAITSHGLAAIRRGHEITEADVDRAVENARAVPLDPNLEILHTLPQEYVVDSQEGIKSPVGMHGVRLEVDVHIVAGTAGPLLNLRRCVQEAGLKVDGFVLQGLASGMATVDTGEQTQTVVVIDIGGGTTDVGVFKRGNLTHSACIPIGGDHVTADLAQILKIPMEEAESVKRRYGAATPEKADPDLALEITAATGSTHSISAHELSRIIRPRLVEIFGLVRDEIDQALGPVELIAQNMILTGGGAQMRGIGDLAKERFRLPVRLGVPRGIGGLVDIVSSPEYASAVGLVLYGINQDGRLPVQPREEERQPEPQEPAKRPLLGKREPRPEREKEEKEKKEAPVPVAPRLPEPQAPAQQIVVRPQPAAQEAPKKSTMDKIRSLFKDWL